MEDEYIPFFGFDMPDYVVPFITREWNETEDIQKELAFHEAGHFVMERLLQKSGLNEIPFGDINYMYIDSDNKQGAVNGFLSLDNLEGNVWTNENYERFKRRFQENPRYTYATLFSLISGYATYKKFIDDNKYFIGFEREGESRLYRIDTVPHSVVKTQYNRYVNDVSDFAKIKERLNFFGITDFDILNNLYGFLLEQVSEIMSNNAVENAIRFTKGLFT